MLFQRYIGIDYSGASHRQKTLRKLGSSIAVCVLPASGEAPDLTKRWSRAELTEWLKRELGPDKPRTIIGLDHGFSLPEPVFQLTSCQTWTDLLSWFQSLYNTTLGHPESLTIDAVRKHLQQSYAPLDRFRLTEQRCSSAKSTLDLVPKQGCVGPGTHQGIYELANLLLPRSSTAQISVWPFDGWDPRAFAENHVIVEVYPSILKRRVQSLAGTTHRDEWDAEAVALWLRDRDQNGILYDHFCPVLTLTEKTSATREGWILGVM